MSNYVQENHIWVLIHLSFSAVNALPNSSLTRINNATHSSSMLNLCICTQRVHASIAHIDIDDNYSGSDHFPMVIYLDFLSLPRMCSGLFSKEQLAWDFAEKD